MENVVIHVVFIHKKLIEAGEPRMEPNMHSPNSNYSLQEYARKVWIVVGIVGSTVFLLYLLWIGLEIVLMSLAGLLFSLSLFIPANFLKQHSFLSYRWALVVVILSIALLITLFILNFSSNVAAQVQKLTEVIPGSLDTLQDRMLEWPLGEKLLSQMEEGESVRGALSNFLVRITEIFSTTFGALVNLVVIIFVGLYVVFEPWTYRRGLLLLVFPKHRDAVSKLLTLVGHEMSWWLLGRIISMVVIGVITGVGLWFIGIPLALSLGLLAGALAFIPYLGPILSSIPALLVSFTIGYAEFLYVAALFFMVQFLESYLVTPYIQRKTVHIPPGLLIIVQFWLSLIGGILGLLLAGPLTALLLVIVNRVYVNGWLLND